MRESSSPKEKGERLLFANASSNRYKIAVDSTREIVEDALANTPFDDQKCQSKGVLASASCEDMFAKRVQEVSKKVTSMS
eukprot:scaffold361943_cov38-Attheya_sp.AAC.1